jgi:hypothetical protein
MKLQQGLNKVKGHQLQPAKLVMPGLRGEFEGTECDIDS